MRYEIIRSPKKSHEDELRKQINSLYQVFHSISKEAFDEAIQALDRRGKRVDRMVNAVVIIAKAESGIMFVSGTGISNIIDVPDDMYQGFRE